jgi:iron complex outermembrane receptor protein
VIKAGLWWERADTGPRARYDYDATLGHGPNGWTVDYRQKVLPGVPQYLEYFQNSGWEQYEPFVDVEWRATPELTITPGVKYVSEKLSVDSDVNQKSRLPFHGSKTFTKTLYFLTANYKVRDNLSVYAQYATGFLLPDISTTQAVNPNLGDLHPQESTNYQAGLVYHGGKFTVDADVYNIEFTNKIQQVTVGTEAVSFNLGGARYKGVEGAVNYQATDNVFLFANGSINSAKAEGASTTINGAPVTIAGGKQIANAPKSTAALGVLFRDDSWSISLADKYTGEQWGAEGEPAAYHIDGYHQTDLKVVYRFDRYRLEAAVYNLFDNQPVSNIKPGKTVPYDQYYFQPERNFQISAKVNF